MDTGVDRQENIRALLRRIFAQNPVDGALRIAPQIPDAGFPAQIFVRRFLNVRFSFDVRLVERELLRFLLIDVVRCPDITKNMRSERAVDVRAHRLNGEINTREADIVLGELRHGWEIDILDVRKWNLGIVAKMFLQLARVVIARQIKLVKARNDPIIHDPDDIRFLHVFRHPADDRPIFARGR